MINLTVTETKAHLLEKIRQADTAMESFVIPKNGKPTAIIMSIDEYEGWLERLRR
ncbi:MAG: type II toxin-antitoxin system Phd/YefM family antitoxin [Nitrospinota bacterium]|jgi:prevent-host-death family protein|nr:type II toxin-antitoxin system Phd/YefM family antitoxin [Nitrospinota bacterium]MDP7581269.1 type II toxin-antitoxin system Phd/YefM family antitoxin [Nitrospinota bacterium]HJN02623.1 type II toxin-antitoxin system Phd/YefM family antitoxin [Nitrospinota bacterium]|tara:strand:+ start:295 stop:459 length:165 start_codon:yes stop_codon:yes gene_type:complete